MGYKLNSNCNCNPKPSSGDETNVCFGAVEIYKSGGSGGVITVDSIAALPNLGDQNIAYIVEKENKVYSPLSIKYALSMLAEGSEGESKKQILDIIYNYNVSSFCKVF